MTDKNIFETKDEYYSNTEARINTILDWESSGMWRLIVAARRYWGTVDNDYKVFWDWLDVQWGLRATINDDGTVMPQIMIVDEAKYTMFLLKFS